MRPHKVLDFIKERCFFLPDSSDPPLTGEPVGKYIAGFQERIIRDAYNPQGEAKKSLVMLSSRKWGKTMISSWLATYCLCEKKGWRGLCSAATYDQSQHLYQLIEKQIKLSPKIDESKFKITKEKIINLENDNELGRIYSEAGTNLGFVKIQSFFVDQLESWNNKSNLVSIESGMLMMRHRPQLIIAANVPLQPSHWSTTYLDRLRKDRDYSFIEYSAPLKERWDTEKAKRAANPFYALYKKNPKRYSHLAGFARNLNKKEAVAKQDTDESVDYRRMTLGQRISQKAYQWIRSEDIKTISLKEVLSWGSRITIGLDLSETTDFSAASVTFFNKKSDKIAFYPILHLAENMAWRQRHQQRQFRRWAAQGFITLQPGRKAVNVLDFLDSVDSFIMKNKLRVEQFVWDRGLVSGSLTDRYPKSTLVASTGYQMGGAIRRAEGRAKQGELFIIGENPCVRWQFDNAICSSTSKGYTILTRGSERESIDICQSLALSIKWERENPEKNYLIASF